MWGSIRMNQEAEGEARAVVSVVSTGRNGRGKARRLRNGYFE